VAAAHADLRARLRDHAARLERALIRREYWRAWEAERTRALEASALATHAQLEVLRYQLNPHFLFNALNSIRASIDEDASRAKRMITELAEFLRYSLLGSSAEPIPLRDEVAAIESYLAIEKIRFENRLQVSIAIEPAGEAALVPPFLVHPLVENAIKHGMDRDHLPLCIELRASCAADSLRIEVANSGRWPESGARARDHRARVGLDNVRQRLARAFPGRAHLEIGERDGWIRAVIEIQREAVPAS
jgi:LytS/YehU family sensor histidine kinase